MNNNLKLELYLHKILKEEYKAILLNEGFKEAVARFKKNDEYLTDDQLKYYIARFKQLKESPKFVQYVKETFPNIKDPRNIDQYKNFNELESSVDKFPSKEIKQPVAEKTKKVVKKKPANATEVKNALLIYEDDVLEIYDGKDKNACIYAKQEINKKTSQDYSWCVARSTDHNLYSNYRYNSAEPSFYIVLNKTKPVRDNYHAFVVQITKNGKYIVTAARNDGDITRSWENILEIEPLLEGKQDLFKYIPITEEERFLSRSTHEPDLMKTFGKYDIVEKYIAIHSLNDNQFLNLPDKLKMKFINNGDWDVLSNSVYDSLSPVMKARYEKLLPEKFFDGFDVNATNALDEIKNVLVSAISDEIKITFLKRFKDGLKYPKRDIPMYNNFISWLYNSGALNDKIVGHLGIPKEQLSQVFKIELDAGDLDNLADSNIYKQWLVDGDLFDYVSYDADFDSYMLNDIDEQNTKRIKEKLIEDHTIDEINEILEAHDIELVEPIDDSGKYNLDDYSLDDLEGVIEDGNSDVKSNITNAYNRASEYGWESEAVDKLHKSVTEMKFFQSLDYGKKGGAVVNLLISMAQVVETGLDTDYEDFFNDPDSAIRTAIMNKEIDIDFDKPYLDNIGGDFSDETYNEELSNNLDR